MSSSSARSRQAFTPLELILVVVIIATVAAVSLQYLQPAGNTTRQRACDVTRQTLQNHADRYYSQAGTWPSRDLAELATQSFAGNLLPACPCQGGRYEMSGAIVICPAHEADRK